MNKSAADDSAILTTFLPPPTLLVIDEAVLFCDLRASEIDSSAADTMLSRIP